MIMRPLAVALLWVSLVARPDRRIVDRVVMGDRRSEQEHACQRADAWTRCALSVFDDTEVTISATFAASETPRTFDLVVENTVVTSRTFKSRDSATVELRVPSPVTHGRTNILVTLRGDVPPLVSLRSIQDHNE